MTTEKIDWIVIKSMAQLPLSREEACLILDTPISEVIRIAHIDQIQIADIRNWANLEKSRHDSAILAGTCPDDACDVLPTKNPIRLYRVEEARLYQRAKNILKNALQNC